MRVEADGLGPGVELLGHRRCDHRRRLGGVRADDSALLDPSTRHRVGSRAADLVEVGLEREVLRRDAYTCQYCGQHTLSLTVDHVTPRHLGGQPTWENLVTACPACNHRKGGRTLEQAQMLLLRMPCEPPSSAEYLFGRHLKDNDDWRPFVSGW